MSTLPDSRTRVALADQNEDEERWLAERRERLTASDFYSWVAVDKPSWWSTSREDILAEKASGAPRRFGKTAAKEAEAQRKMRFGRHLEVPYLRYFCEATGIIATPMHTLFGQDGWPGLAATLDGVAELPSGTFNDFDESWFSNPDTVYAALYAAGKVGGTGIYEGKSTGEWPFKKSWLVKGIPDYYQMQPRLQMVIAEVDWCIVVCGAGQDMTAETITWEYGEREEFKLLCDDVNAEFCEAMEERIAV